MFGVISRRLVTGGALLLAAFLAADAADIDDDLPDLADQVGQMASEVALELQQVCPPASPSDQAAFDRCRRSLFGDSALRRSLAPRLLWGRRNQDAGAALKDTNLTQFAPDVIAGLYLSLFMYSGEYSTEYVGRERLYLIRLRAGFRNLLPPGQFPYPFWHLKRRSGVFIRPPIRFCSGSIQRPRRSSSGNLPSGAATALLSPRNRSRPNSMATGCGWTRRDASSRA